MVSYLARRFAFALILVFVVSSGALLLTRLAPGDITTVEGAGLSRQVREAERARLGLDRPVGAQYAAWLARAVRFDFGTSLMYGRPVSDLVGERARNTILLASTTLLLATIVGLPLGVLAGSIRRGPWPALIRAASLVILSLPSLVTALVMVFIAARTGWFPIGGMSSLSTASAGWLAWATDVAWHLVVPTLALGLPLAAAIERVQAQAMAETLREPFVLTAMARGTPRRRLIWRSALRPALRPLVGVYGVMLGSLLSGSFVVEIATSWPGIGRLMYDGLRARDLYLVSGCAAVGGAFLAAGGLLSDIMLMIVDPRLRSRPEAPR